MIVGIDVGLEGGIALLSEDGRPLELLVMPITCKILDFTKIKSILPLNMIRHVFLERAHAFPKQGVSSSFNYGRHFGHIEGVISAQNIPYTLVSPSVWTRRMHEGINKDLHPKQRSLLAVQRLFPGVNLRATERCKKAHTGIVDALLIAEYGRHKICGELKQVEHLRWRKGKAYAAF